MYKMSKGGLQTRWDAKGQLKQVLTALLRSARSRRYNGLAQRGIIRNARSTYSWTAQTHDADLVGTCAGGQRRQQGGVARLGAEALAMCGDSQAPWQM